jgi:magnesium transporter
MGYCKIVMLQKFSFHNIDWIDLESPTTEDIKEVQERYGIHQTAATHLLSPVTKPRIDFFEDHIYLVLHFPILDEKNRTLHTREVDFILGKHYIITGHYKPIPELHELSSIFELENTMPHTKGKHAGFLFLYIMRHLYTSIENELSFVNQQLDKIESHIFAGNEHTMVRHLSHVGRHLINFTKTIKDHSDILESFEKLSQKMYGEDFAAYATLIRNAYTKIWHMAENTRDVFRELRETNDSLLSTKTNDTMKSLTVMAFITYPLALVAGVFGMNTKNTPFVGNVYDFWIIIAIMISLAVIFFGFFKYKKWL